MKITRLTVGNQAAVQLKAVQPKGATLVGQAPTATIYPKCELTAELSEGEDVEACAAALRTTVEAELAKHVQQAQQVHDATSRAAQFAERRAKYEYEESLRMAQLSGESIRK